MLAILMAGRSSSDLDLFLEPVADAVSRVREIRHDDPAERQAYMDKAFADPFDD
jgi:hypothetical protein